jgi:peptidoglycan/LPS O-acetylase OafA/YrhL
VAAMIVFMDHATKQTVLPGGYFGKGFGQSGVMIFFLLSGFLMSHLYLSGKFESFELKKYISARIGRVFPLYFLLLIISLVLTKFMGFDFYYNFNDIKLFFLSFFLLKAPYTFWTIPVEVQFYIIFIGFWFLYKTMNDRLILTAYVVITAIPSILWYISYHQAPFVVSLFSFVFFIGVLTGIYYETLYENQMIRSICNKMGIIFLIAVFCNLPYFKLQYGLVYSEQFFFRTWGDPLTLLIVFSLFFCAVMQSESLAILNRKWFYELGNISYGFYLFHYPIVYSVKNLDINAVAKVILTVSVTLLIAYISFHYFEKPAGRIIRYLVRGTEWKRSNA